MESIVGLSKSDNDFLEVKSLDELIEAWFTTRCADDILSFFDCSIGVDLEDPLNTKKCISDLLNRLRGAVLRCGGTIEL